MLRGVMDNGAKTNATSEALLAVPAHLIAEIIRGTLHTRPRPAGFHSMVSSSLGGELHGFARGRGGPGGWQLLDEPELHLGAEILVPDLAGWRKERMPQVPDVAYFTLAPDWVCEVLSPSTAAMDRAEKLPIYAEHQVGFAWLIDLRVQTLEVFRLDGATYRLVKTWRGSDEARAEPFDAIELSLSQLWPEGSATPSSTS
jgi:Uma2 family endonuclease